MNSITFLGTHKSGVVVVLVLSESEVLGWNVKKPFFFFPRSWPPRIKHMLARQHVMTHDA